MILFPRRQKLRSSQSGFEWAEGPVWVSEGDYLLFSDVPANKIYKWKEGEGLSTYLENSGYNGEDDYSEEPGSNGLMVNKEGKLLLCQHGNRQVAIMDRAMGNPAPEYTSLARFYEGKRLNSPNDLALYKDGSIYFTDPPYGLPGRADSPEKELDFFGVYKIDPSGNLTLMARHLSRPNGIAFNNEFSKCYINLSDPENPVTLSFDVNPADGSFRNETVFFDAKELLSQGKGLPDGLKVHPETDILFTTGPGGVLIISPNGKHLGTIHTGKATANCCFDDELKYLYMTADDTLMRIELKK